MASTLTHTVTKTSTSTLTQTIATTTRTSTGSSATVTGGYVVLGSMLMWVSNATQFVADTSAKTAVQASIAAIAHVSMEQVRVSLSVVDAGRLLKLFGASRRLQGDAGDVHVDYTITLAGSTQDVGTDVQTRMATATDRDLNDEIRQNLATSPGGGAYDLIVLSVYDAQVIGRRAEGSSTSVVSTVTAYSTMTLETSTSPLPLSPSAETDWDIFGIQLPFAVPWRSNSLTLVLVIIGGFVLTCCIVAVTTSRLSRPRCKEAKALELCAARRPVPGDHVYRVDASAVRCKSGWTLEQGAIAVVDSVDPDGDFKLRNPEGEISEVLHRSLYAYTTEATAKFEWTVPASQAKVLRRGQKLVSEEFYLQCTSSPLRLWYYPKGLSNRRDNTCAVYVVAGAAVPQVSLQLSLAGRSRELLERWAAFEHRGFDDFCAAPDGDITLRLETVQVQAKCGPSKEQARRHEEKRRKAPMPPKEEPSPTHRKEVHPAAEEACPGAGVGSFDEVPVAAAPAAILCPEGHPMLPVEKPRHNCDLCGAKGTSYRCMLGCDYDLCLECNQLGQGPPVILHMDRYMGDVDDDEPHRYVADAVCYANQRPRVPEGCIIRLNKHHEGVEERIIGTSPPRPHSDVPERAHFVL